MDAKSFTSQWIEYLSWLLYFGRLSFHRIWNNLLTYITYILLTSFELIKGATGIVNKMIYDDDK